MTSNMLQVLKDASKRPLRRVHHTGPGSVAWPAKWQALYALERRGLLERSSRLSRAGMPLEEWTVTEAGKAALRGPEWRGWQRPVFPARGGGSTSDWTRAVDHDPQMGALDNLDAPSEEWLRVSKVKRAAAEDRKAAARVLAQQARRAA